MDAKVELVSLESSQAKKPNLYSFGIHPWKIGDDVNEILEEMDLSCSYYKYDIDDLGSIMD